MYPLIRYNIFGLIDKILPTTSLVETIFNKKE